jgi:hypothetical protein
VAWLTGARLENEAGQRHRLKPKRVNARAISKLTFRNDHSCASVNLDVRRGFEPDVSQSYHKQIPHLAKSVALVTLIALFQACIPA